jgi:hypothetical protein
MDTSSFDSGFWICDFRLGMSMSAGMPQIENLKSEIENPMGINCGAPGWEAGGGETHPNGGLYHLRFQIYDLRLGAFPPV